MEALLEDVSFNATGEHPMLDVIIDRNYVKSVFKDRRMTFDMTKYVL